MRGKEKVPRFLYRSLSTQTYFRSSLFLLPGGEKRRPEIHLHSQATYTEVNLKNSYLMYVCRQLLYHPEVRGFIPELRSFPTDCPPKITGRGRRGQCQKFVTSLVCLLHSAESEKLKLLLDGAYDLFVIPDMSKLKQIIN